MSYNPVFDLLFGLFLLLVPFAVLLGLIYASFRQKPKPKENPESTVENPPWEEWVRTTLQQAYRWREQMSRKSLEGEPGLDAHSTRSPEDIEGLIVLLENLRNGSPAQVSSKTSSEEE